MRSLVACCLCSLLAAACEPNVVEAVRRPPAMPEPEPKPDPKPEPEPEPEPSPLEVSLIHRYSFDGEGEEILDSKGAAHGSVVAAVLDGSGQLSLTAEPSGQYVVLPSRLISGLSSATFEIWLTWDGGPAWQRLFDFGSSTEGVGLPGPNGAGYLFLTTESANDPVRGLPGALRVAFSEFAVSDEEICHGPAPLPVGVPVHVALVIDPGVETMSLYQDGELLTDCVLTRPLSVIPDVNCWLGRSNYVADPELRGSLDEFRIYDAALSAEQIAASFNAGPNAKP